MFGSLSKKLKGVLTFDELAERSERHIEVAISGDAKVSTWLQQLDANLEWFEAWLDRHNDMLRRIADSPSRTEQIIALRRETLEAIEQSTEALPFLLDELSEEDKRVLATAAHPDMSFEEVGAFYWEGYVYAQASTRCLRLISFELEDAKKDDWLDLYMDIYGEYVRASNREIIAQAKGETDLLGALLPVDKQIVDDAREKVLQGLNWNYDREAGSHDQET